MRHTIFVGKAMTGKTHTLKQVSARSNAIVVTEHLEDKWPVMWVNLEEALLLAPYEDTECTYILDNIEAHLEHPKFYQLIEAIKQNEHIHLVAAGQDEGVVRDALKPLLDECEFVFKTRDWK